MSKAKQKQQSAQKEKKSSGPAGSALRGGDRAKLEVKDDQSRKQARRARHPNLVECTVTCTCGNQFVTRSISPEIKTDVCSACHPFFSGQARFVDTAGRIEKFQRRYNWKDGKSDKGKGKEKAKAKKPAATQSLED